MARGEDDVKFARKRSGIDDSLWRFISFGWFHPLEGAATASRCRHCGVWIVVVRMMWYEETKKEDQGKRQEWWMNNAWPEWRASDDN